MGHWLGSRPIHLLSVWCLQSVFRCSDIVVPTLTDPPHSATIFGKLLSAGRVTMWKNTDGVYTADPRRVPEAFPIASLKYDEAMELAYFGAQVLWLGSLLPRLLTTPNGSQWLPTTPDSSLRLQTHAVVGFQ